MAPDAKARLGLMSLGMKVMWIGVAIWVAGFAAAWTDRTYGLLQVLHIELFEDLGKWVMRIGWSIALVGSVIYLTQLAT